LSGAVGVSGPTQLFSPTIGVMGNREKASATTFFSALTQWKVALVFPQQKQNHPMSFLRVVESVLMHS
jgi:hypothetical protein